MTPPKPGGRWTNADVVAALRGLFPPRDWSVHPGDLLHEELRERGMTQVDFAQRSNYTTKHVNSVCVGKRPMSTEMAVACETVLGIPAVVLVRLQADWDLWALRNAAPGGRS